ncbi:MAG: 3-deoxy-8-phosphooctulonate synthase [Verrucomicrobiota bacterium]|nr:3-deoxy-8-phosphooctulonate synthase [Verrucomicrobiota bacterium]
MRTIKSFEIKNGVGVGPDYPLLLISGPCVIEDLDTCREIAEAMIVIAEKHKVGYVFKASFDKANRSSIKSYRGPGLRKGLEILENIKEEFRVPIVTDIHESIQVTEVAAVADILQIPAFLCRQTDLIVTAAKTGKVVNIKKGQFMAPDDMKNVITKAEESGNSRLMLTERGISFGYNNLIVDMRALVMMKQMGYPIVFDATHSVQLPGGQGTTSGGQREFVEPLAKAATAVGINALFLEVHPEPKKAMSDGTNSLTPEQADKLLKKVTQIHNLEQS